MSANVVEVSYNLAIMSIVMQSSSMPLEEIAVLNGKVFTWYLDNVPPTRDPQTGQETPQIRELLQKTGASFVVQVLFQQIHVCIHCLDTHDSHIHTLSCTRKHHGAHDPTSCISTLCADIHVHRTFLTFWLLPSRRWT